MEKENRKLITTAFTLSVVANGLLDFLIIILYAAKAMNSSGSGLPFSYAGSLFVLITLLIAPIVLGITSLVMIKKTESTEPKERIFGILSRIFSIIAIVGSGTVILIAGFLVGLVLLIIF